MVLRKIESLREQPKAVRNRFAFWWAFLFTAVVVVFWMTSLPARMTVLTGVIPKEETQGGASHAWERMKASVFESVNLGEDEAADEAPVLVEEAEDKNTQGAWAAHIASTSPQHPAREGRPVLISTSSQKEASSTE